MISASTLTKMTPVVASTRTDTPWSATAVVDAGEKIVVGLTWPRHRKTRAQYSPCETGGIAPHWPLPAHNNAQR